jgi:hypothetical protein
MLLTLGTRIYDELPITKYTGSLAKPSISVPHAIDPTSDFRFFPHPPTDRLHNHERYGVHLTHPDAVSGVGVWAGDYLQGQEEETGMGEGMGRHWSQSAGANLVPYPHADPHGPAFANAPSFECPAGTTTISS